MVDDVHRLSLEEAVGQLLCPLLSGQDCEQFKRWQESEHYGSVFFNKRTFDEFGEAIAAVQGVANSPVLVSADLEHGANAIIDKSTEFPWSMAVAAAGSRRLAYDLGRATAKEGRSLGIHWTFAPVVDINYNYRAPESNIRTYGDDPEVVLEMALATIRGIQEEGLMAACAKHFPGAGIDERDQHLLTSVNPLNVQGWWDTYGKIWQAVIDAGVMSIMSGHISFPAWQNVEDINSALPATLCPKIQSELLRKELGFKGVLISDALPMIGLTSRIPEGDAVVNFINSGGDVLLFAVPERDHARLIRAVRDGEVSEDRIFESAQRVLNLKVKLGLDRDLRCQEPSEKEVESFRISSTHIAEKSITVLKDDGKVGLAPSLDSSILTVTLDYEGHKFLPQELEEFDRSLMAYGYTNMEHWRNPGSDSLVQRAGEFDVVFLNFHLLPHMLIGHTRLYMPLAMNFWHGFYVGHKDVRCTSFGSPYILHDQPALPNMLLAYGGVGPSQRAAVDVWLGKLKAVGVSPVKQPTIRLMDAYPDA